MGGNRLRASAIGPRWFDSSPPHECTSSSVAERSARLCASPGGRRFKSFGVRPFSLNRQLKGTSRIMERLYVVTRKDLIPGLQLAQSVHAAVAFVHQFPELEGKWYTISNNLACLACENEEELKARLELVKAHGLSATEFREPDLGDALTSFSVESGAKKLLRDLPVALQDLIAAHNALSQAA